MLLINRFRMPLEIPDGLTTPNVERLRAVVLAYAVIAVINTDRPIRLFEFAQSVAESVDFEVRDIYELCHGIKTLLWCVDHPIVRIIGTSMPDVGYLFDRTNRETWPLGV